METLPLFQITWKFFVNRISLSFIKIVYHSFIKIINIVQFNPLLTHVDLEARITCKICSMPLESWPGHIPGNA